MLDKLMQSGWHGIKLLKMTLCMPAEEMLKNTLLFIKRMKAHCAGLGVCEFGLILEKPIPYIFPFI